MLRRFKQDTVFYQATNFKTNWFQARVIKQVLSGCASVIGANEYISSLLGKAGLLTSVVLPGVMVEDFRLLLSSDEIKVPGKDVVFMGHLSEIKGADVVVSLARNLTHRTFSFVAGYSSRKKDVLFYNKVKLEIDDLPNASHVAMVPNPLEYLRVCKVMVLPYRSGDSVLGVAQSAIEAMLMGIPVVSTSNAALSSLLVDGVNGYICSSYDEMLEAIERLLDDNALYSKFSEEAKKTALTNHDALKNINGFLK